MNTTTAAKDNLPTADKPESKPSKAKEKTESIPLVIKATLINPAWSDELTASFNLTGPLAKAVASEVSAALTRIVSKQCTRPKLAKLIRAAVNRSIT